MSTRKSSVGPARRVVQKAHIPYRADELDVGKKTGVVVNRVDRKSDGFEPFEDVLDLMNRKTSSRQKTNGRIRNKVPSPVVDDGEDGENGEMSMDLTDSSPAAAYSHFTNSRHLLAPDSVNRGASSSHRTRSSNANVDRVSSPRTPRNTAKRQSMVNGTAAASATKSQSFVASDDRGGVDDRSFEDFGQPENDVPANSSPRKTSFSEIDQDDEDVPELQNNLSSSSPVRPKTKDKGKEKAQAVEEEHEDAQDQGIEDEIARGLGEVEHGEDEEDGVEPHVKKARTEKQADAATRGRPRKRKAKTEPDRSPTPDGVRRSRRHRYAPLEFWRLEKVVYGKPDSGAKTLVPHIKEIVRIPKEPAQPLGRYKRKRSAAPRAKSTPTPTPEPEPEPANPEVDWDKDTQALGVVLDFSNREEVERHIAHTSRMVAPKAAADNLWYFQKIFNDGDFIAAGQLLIPPKGRKPSKGTKDNTYVFYVIEGAINVRIHNSSFVLATGGMFMVPRGNTYYFENIADRNAKLFFTQARKTAMSQEEQVSAAQFAAPRRSSDSQRPSSRPPTATGRSSSVGQVNGRISSKDRDPGGSSAQ